MADKTVHIFQKSGAVDLTAHTDATAIVFTDCHITDLNISGLVNLTSINLSKVGKNTLTTLNMSGCSSITALDISGCVVLTNLNVSGLAITTLDLTGLTSLTLLTASGCTSITTLTALSSLTALVTLDLSGCVSITSLSISSNTALTWLDVSNTSLIAIDIISNLVLEHIDIHGCNSGPSGIGIGWYFYNDPEWPYKYHVYPYPLNFFNGENSFYMTPDIEVSANACYRGGLSGGSINLLGCGEPDELIKAELDYLSGTMGWTVQYDGGGGPV